MYPRSLLIAGVEGAVRFKAVIDEKGNVAEVAILESTNRDFDAAALKAFTKWRFQPSTYEGVPIRTAIDFRLEFRVAR